MYQCLHVLTRVLGTLFFFLFCSFLSFFFGHFRRRDRFIITFRVGILDARCRAKTSIHFYIATDTCGHSRLRHLLYDTGLVVF